MADAKPLNNFKTAVNELMNGKLKTDDSSYFKTDIANTANSTYNSGTEASEMNSFNTSPVYPQTSYGTPEPSSPADGESVLSADLLIEGNLKSKSAITLNGYVKGDIVCEGCFTTCGTVDGNVKALSVTLVGSAINGNIISKGDLSLDCNSTIIGDIRAASITLNGKIKGNIVVSNNAALQEKAMVLGNITAKSISVENGASIKGSMEIKSTALANDSFPEKKGQAPVRPDAAKAPVKEEASFSKAIPSVTEAPQNPGLYE